MIDTSRIISGLSKDRDAAWKTGKHAGFKSLSNQAKGKFGVAVTAEILKSQGFTTKGISDEGDLLYWDEATAGSPRKVEVKTAAAKVSGDSWASWFNQIRPNQTGWHEVWLVTVYPNHVRVYRKDRQGLISSVTTMSSTKNALSHTGTDDLIGVMMGPSNENEWDCCYNDFNGNLL